MSKLSKQIAYTAITVALVSWALAESIIFFSQTGYESEAEELADRGIIEPRATESEYHLGDFLTRAEIAKIAVKIAGIQPWDCKGSYFSDVNASLGNLCGYVETAADAGIVSKKDPKFRPGDDVTRAEMAKILLSSKGVAPSTKASGFADVSTGSWDLAGYLSAGIERGCIESGPIFRPKNAATRWEAFKLAVCVAKLK